MYGIETGSGFWDPLMWVSAAVIIFLIIYLLRTFGRKSYKKKTGQTKAFLSGNPELSEEQMHIGGTNLYWGFRETLKGYYHYLFKMHTGNISDYVLWFVVTLAVLFIIIGVI